LPTKISAKFRELQCSARLFVTQGEFACNNGDNHVLVENATQEKEGRKGLVKERAVEEGDSKIEDNGLET